MKPVMFLLRSSLCMALVITLSGCLARNESDTKLHACTLLGGGPPETATIVVRRPDGKPPDFDVRLEVDGKAWLCHYQTDFDNLDLLPEEPSCSREINVIVEEAPECAHDGTCENNGKFEEYIVVFAKPKVIRVSLINARGTVTSRDFWPHYKAQYVNGPECEPLTWRWQEVWVVRTVG